MTSPSSSGPHLPSAPHKQSSGAQGTQGGEAPHAAVSNKHIVSVGCAVRVQRVTISQQWVYWLQREGMSCCQTLSLRAEGGEGVRHRGRRRRRKKGDGDLEDTAALLTPPCPLLSSQRVTEVWRSEQWAWQTKKLFFKSFLSFFFWSMIQILILFICNMENGPETSNHRTEDSVKCTTNSVWKLKFTVLTKLVKL